MTIDVTLPFRQNEIDTEIDVFTRWVRSDINAKCFSSRASVWLTLEHYQFSKRNPCLLIKGAQILGGLRNQRISRTLFENYREESTHPPAYRKSLREYEIFVEDRKRFPATDRFLDTLQSIVEMGPSQALGALYATESAALLEHQVLNELSRDLAVERGFVYADSALASFHALHLNGVEEAHARELGVCLQTGDAELTHDAVLRGTQEAVAAMTAWWASIFSLI